MGEGSAAWAGVAGAALFVGSVLVGGAGLEGYSHSTQFISETYATGTAWGPALRKFGFVPAGLFLAFFGIAGSVIQKNNRPLALGLAGYALFYGIGTVVVSLAPCDNGCDPQQASPTLAHTIHFAVGGLTYLLTPPSLALIAIGMRTAPGLARFSPLVLGTAVLMAICSLLIFTGNPPGLLGLVQRLGESAALAVPIILATAWLASKRKHATSAA